jgi:hypothetical protein
MEGDNTTLDALMFLSKFWQAQVYQEMLRFSCTLRRAHVPKYELDVIPILWDN